MKKRILPILLSAALAFAMPITAFADNEKPEQPASPAAAEIVNHEYESFQIFKGEEGLLDGKKVLLTVEWGADASQAVQDAIWAQIHADGFKVYDDKNVEITDQAKATATDIARAIEAKYPNSEKVGVDAEKLAKVIAKVIGDQTGAAIADNTTFTGDAGWYLIVDKTPSLWGDYAMYKDRSQLKFLFDKDTFKVTTKRSVIKIEKEVEDINDSVTVVDPVDKKTADYDIGDAVPFTLTATLPENLKEYTSYTFTINDRQDKGFDFPQNITVTVDGVDYTLAADAVKTKDYDGDGENNDFDIEFGDVAKNAAFKAGSKVVVKYTSVLNDKAKTGNPGNENTSSITYNPNNEGEGHTPWDIVIVFTFKPEIDKINNKNQPLKGAGFTITKLVKGEDVKNIANWDIVQKDGKNYQEEMTIADNGTHFSFNGIDDGVYRIEETTVPDGYNKCDDIYIEVKATHDIKGKLTKLEVYDLLTGELLGSSSSAADGTITNLGTMPVSLTDGNFTDTIVNNEGVVLPSTGGIGTTIFYVIGGVLVVGAVVLLIVRRRMKTEEE